MSAIYRSDVGMEAISQVVPISFIHVPIFEIVMAIHITINRGDWNGAVRGACFKVVVGAIELSVEV